MCIKKMNGWETHEVDFRPAEGLSKNETSIRVLDEDVEDEDEAVEKIAERIDRIDDQQDHAELLHLRQQMTNKIKKDPGYKFLMQVSAFSKLKLGNMIHDDLNRHANQFDLIRENACEGSCAIPQHVDRRWMEAPEITGVVQLSGAVYGHIKEAEMIVRNRCGSVSLKKLVEDPRYQTAFARLVGIRIILSGVLTGLGNRRDRSFQRLHQEQHMILKQFDRIEVLVQRDWTKPVSFDWK